MNENENITSPTQLLENNTESEEKCDLPAPCSASANEPVPDEIKAAETSSLHDAEVRSFLSRVIRFAYQRILPISLSMFSLTVMISLASSFIGDLDLSGAHIVQLMLGDLVGGADYVTYISDENSSDISANDSLESDSALGTVEKNPPPNEDRADTLSLLNETPYSPDMEELLKNPRAIPTAEEIYAEYGDGAPIVLIIHTHATESFADTASDSYRSELAEKNVIAIGKVIADKLQNSGISVIHCTELFDIPDFGMAYYNASQAIRNYINEYPSIAYVLDIHRDSIELEDGTNYAPTSITSLGRAAQIMFVIGTDHGGSDHTEWKDNLSLAARLQTAVSADYPSLMRSINLRSASFNEQYTKGSLLIEVGASASTLDEAKLSAEILAEYLVREIIG